MWLEQLLPQRIPDSRVMTFGYNAKIIGNVSTNGIGDTARVLLRDILNKRDGVCARSDSRLREKQQTEIMQVEKRPIVLIGHRFVPVLPQRLALEYFLITRR
jgi:hypothetical protein